MTLNFVIVAYKLLDIASLKSNQSPDLNPKRYKEV